MRSLVYEAGLIYLPKIKNRAGNITPVQNNKLPFDVKRVFYLYDIPGGESRGGHAHRARLQQHLNDDGIQTLILIFIIHFSFYLYFYFSFFFAFSFLIFFLGGIMLFCLWDQNFSFKQKVGILIGVTLQIFSGMIQVEIKIKIK